MKMNQKLNIHPMIIFWLGVITGALIMGIIFLERVVNLLDYQSALYKFSPKIYEQQLEKAPKFIRPDSLDKSIQLDEGDKLQKLDPDAYGSMDPIPSP